LGAFYPQNIVISEDLSNVKEEIDRMTYKIIEIHNTGTFILNSFGTISQFADSEIQLELLLDGK
jgi:hypothetical protein